MLLVLCVIAGSCWTPEHNHHIQIKTTFPLSCTMLELLWHTLTQLFTVTTLNTEGQYTVYCCGAALSHTLKFCPQKKKKKHKRMRS